MRDFMNPPKIKPVCPSIPVHDQLKELEKYRLYIMKHMEACYKKMVEELEAITPENLETLNNAIGEYKELSAGIDSKLNQMEEMINSFIESYQAHSIDNLRLFYDYDEHTKNLSYRIGKKVEA